MVMNEKYYQPSIEEFYVGFSYQLLKDKVWKECEFDEFAFDYEEWESDYGDEYNIINALEDEYIRVKYLDQSDLESLGFKVQTIDQGEDTTNELYILKDDAVLGSFFGLQQWADGAYYNLQLYNSYYLVKNRSALIKLLKQLNIEL